MSKITDAVENAAYSMDWYKRRNNVLDAIIPFAYGDDCQKRIIGQKHAEDDYNIILRSMFFMYENCLYVWTDILENGLIESSQLEQVYNSSEFNGMRMSYMIYKHDTNDMPLGPLMVQKLLDNELEILEET